MLRFATLALALLAPHALAQTVLPAAAPPATHVTLDLPALDARSLGVVRALFSSPRLASQKASPDRRERSSRDLHAFSSTIVGVRGPLRRLHLIGSNVRADGAVETFVRAEFRDGAEGLRVVWKNGHLVTVQRGAPPASYAAASE